MRLTPPAASVISSALQRVTVLDCNECCNSFFDGSQQDHADRADTHIISAIINVDQDLDEPWPLDIIGHGGKLTKVHSLTCEDGLSSACDGLCCRLGRFLPQTVLQTGCCGSELCQRTRTLVAPAPVSATLLPPGGVLCCSSACSLSRSVCMQVTMKPGDMVLYEGAHLPLAHDVVTCDRSASHAGSTRCFSGLSAVKQPYPAPAAGASCAHGRPSPLVGRYMANVFLHVSWCPPHITVPYVRRMSACNVDVHSVCRHVLLTSCPMACADASAGQAAGIHWPSLRNRGFHAEEMIPLVLLLLSLSLLFRD